MTVGQPARSTMDEGWVRRLLGRWESMHLLELSQTVDPDRLCKFLRDVHVTVGALGGGMLEASIPGAPTEHHERRELLGYVTTWNALNPAMRVELA